MALGFGTPGSMGTNPGATGFYQGVNMEFDDDFDVRELDGVNMDFDDDPKSSS